MGDSARVAELKGHLKTQAGIMDGILAEMKDETGNGNFVLPTEKASAFATAKKNADEIKGLIEAEMSVGEYQALASEQKALAESKSMESKGLQADAMSAFREGGAAGFAEAMGLNTKSWGEAFVESDEFKEFKSVREGKGRAMEVKDVYTTLAPTVTNLGFGSTQREPMIERMHRKQRVRDLLGSRQTTSNLIEFYKVTGLTNNANVVAERDTEPTPDVFAIKPQSALQFDAEQAPVRTIAHWEAAHRNVLDDEPQLRGIIDNELLYGLRLTEDAQLLSGSGSGENVLGLLNTPGVQVYDWSDGPTTGVVAADNRADCVRRAVTKVILSNYEATGIVMHPLDWEAIELAKDAEARYLITVAVAVGAEQRLWRLPVVDTPVIPQGTYLTGAFGLGATIYDRSAPSVRVATEHADFFVRNALAILAEQRLALAVKRPEAFVKGSFDAPPVLAGPGSD